jgi:hypothetical protein
LPDFAFGSAAIQQINPTQRKSNGDFYRLNRHRRRFMLVVWPKTTGWPAVAEASRQMPMPPVNLAREPGTSGFQRLWLEMGLTLGPPAWAAPRSLSLSYGPAATVGRDQAWTPAFDPDFSTVSL